MAVCGCVHSAVASAHWCRSLRAATYSTHFVYSFVFRFFCFLSSSCTNNIVYDKRVLRSESITLTYMTTKWIRNHSQAYQPPFAAKQDALLNQNVLIFMQQQDYLNPKKNPVKLRQMPRETRIYEENSTKSKMEWLRCSECTAKMYTLCNFNRLLNQLTN